ncbi:glycosyltransferase [Edaphobacter albus]|uniref:glycosyltransferase n=1 Tax=Edaphobacter sp. 4G125 TaxID=2763071 RepID=UPI001645205E|nr:glycosyltransferase [Edaphobacter sp. 4G125]QNI38177.1 glycosyltransferase [Edaphobacter sp. 4G125]
MIALLIIAWLVTLAWLWKAATAVCGLPHIPNLLEPKFDRAPEGSPSITVIVPARDEAAALPLCLSSLLAQDYKNLRIIAVDDRSTDGTGAIMDALAVHHPERLRVLHVKQLSAGWLGKPHAMALAARDAIVMERPDYLLFTDADVIFQSEAIRRSLAQAVATQADHFVTFPTPLVKTFGEGVLLGYLGVMGLWVTRPWKAADPKAKRDFIGIGAFNLLRTEAYEKLGGFEALRMEILEDLVLARKVKLAGLHQQVATAPGMVSLHWAAGTMGVVKGMTKNLFAIFRFRIEVVVFACIALAVLCLGPIGFLFPAQTKFPAEIALASIAALYIVSARHSKISPWYALLFPAGAALFLYSLLRSSWITVREGGVTWRGTFYPLVELRRGLVSLRE